MSQMRVKKRTHSQMETGLLSLVGLSKEGGMETLWRKVSQRPKGRAIILKDPER